MVTNFHCSFVIIYFIIIIIINYIYLVIFSPVKIKEEINTMMGLIKVAVCFQQLGNIW